MSFFVVSSIAISELIRGVLVYDQGPKMISCGDASDLADSTVVQ